MPALVLPSGERVHIDYGVQAFGCAGIHYPVDEAETLGLDNRGVQIIHKVPMVDRYADAIETQRRKELGVFYGEEVLEKLDSI